MTVSQKTTEHIKMRSNENVYNWKQASLTPAACEAPAAFDNTGLNTSETLKLLIQSIH